MLPSFKTGGAGWACARDLLAMASGTILVTTARAQEMKPTEQILVTGDVIVDGYATNEAGTGTKTDSPLMLTPLSVQVVPQQLPPESRSVGLRSNSQHSSKPTNCSA